MFSQTQIGFKYELRLQANNKLVKRLAKTRFSFQITKQA